MSQPRISPPAPTTTATIKKENRRAVQQLMRANRATVTHVNGWEHPLSSPRLQFWRSFRLAAVSLSPPNLIGKPRACHGVLAAHIRTNALRESDTNLSERWQKNDARGREALARGGYTAQSPAPVLMFISAVEEQNQRSAHKWYQPSGFRRELHSNTETRIHNRSHLLCA